MPRRKNHMIAKQKRLITTRLMQISLLIDDYLYKQKPMSEGSAETFISEIAGFKDRCNHDARSLQVIEKLTRCMTGIIYEQQELHGAGAGDINTPLYQDNVNDTNVIPYQAKEDETSIMLSPVYSVIDEDLTQIPMYLEEELIGLTSKNIANNLNNNTNLSSQTGGISDIDPLCMDAVETEQNIYVNTVQNAAGFTFGIESASEVIDLCEGDIDDPDQNHTSFRHEPEFKIQNAISNLSIKDIGEAFTTFSQCCSQSILDNFNTPTIPFQPKVTIVPPTNYDDDVRIAAITQKAAADIVLFKDGPTKIVLPTTKQKVNVKDNVKKPVVNYAEKKQKNGIISVNTNEPYNQKQTKNNSRKSNIIKRNSNKPNATKKATKKKLQENKVLSVKEKPLAKTYTNKNKPSMQGYQLDTNMQASTYQNIQTTASINTNIVRHNISDNAVPPTQNKIISTYVQDLSWVENIRFVREIQVEEYEPFTDEGFWENCDLPANFNGDDFNF